MTGIDVDVNDASGILVEIKPTNQNPATVISNTQQSILVTIDKSIVADLDAFTTDDLAEGATNFYYTEARFDTSLAASNAIVGNLSIFDNAITRADGGGGSTLQASLIFITDGGKLQALSLPGFHELPGAGTASLCIGSGTSAATALNSTSLGVNSTATADSATALGRNSSALAISAIALGSFANASNTGGVAVGNFSGAPGFGGTAIGLLSFANATAAIAIGNSASATGTSATAVGGSANAAAENSLAVGKDATVLSTHTNSIAVGGATTNKPDQLKLAAKFITLAGLLETETVTIDDTDSPFDLTTEFVTFVDKSGGNVDINLPPVEDVTSNGAGALLFIKPLSTANTMQIICFQGVEIITDGDMPNNTNWTEGTGIVIGSGVASYDGTQVADTDLTQVEADFAGGETLEEDLFFEVTFDVSNYVAGNVTPVVGNTEGTDRAANGTFTEVILAGAGSDISIRGDLNFVGDIDNVSIVHTDVIGNTGTATTKNTTTQVTVPLSIIADVNQHRWRILTDVL